jgi:hypothetical protein
MTRRKLAGWDEGYLLQLLLGIPGAYRCQHLLGARGEEEGVKRFPEL